MKKKTMLVVAGLLAAALVAVSAYQLYHIYAEYAAGEELYDSVAVEYVSPHKTPSPSANRPVLTEEPAEGQPVEINFATLTARYPDVVGWIYSEGTIINYPVMQGTDNGYYLSRMIDGYSNNAGSLFLDYRNSRDFGDLNSVVYGHNMKSGTMFGSLSQYAAQDYYEEHPVLWLLTPGGDYRIDLLAGFVTPADSETYELFVDEARLREYLEGSVDASDFVSTVDLDAVERIITLSTCTYDFQEARYVVIGNLVPIGGDAEEEA